MTIINTHGLPFSSVGGDRMYGSMDWRQFFECLMTNGVISFVGDELEVVASSTPAKTVEVGLGGIYIEGIMRIPDEVQVLNIDENVSGNPRIDLIVARLNSTDRQIEFDVLKGTPESSPIPPDLTQTSSVWEIALAEISLANGYSVITSSEITDRRSFGVVKASHNFTVTLDKDNWLVGATGGYEQTVPVGGILETDDGMVQVDYTGITDFTVKGDLHYYFSLMINISAGANEITAYNFQEPIVDIPLRIKVVR